MFNKSNDGDFLLTTECSGKKTSNLLTDIFLSTDKSGKGKFAIEYPVRQGAFHA